MTSSVGSPYWAYGADRELAARADRALPLAEGERELFLVKARLAGGAPAAALLTDRRIALLDLDRDVVAEFPLASLTARYIVELNHPVVELRSAGAEAVSFSVVRAPAPRPAEFDSARWIGADAEADRFRDPTARAFELIRDASRPPGVAHPSKRRVVRKAREAPPSDDALEAKALMAVRRDEEAIDLLTAAGASSGEDARSAMLLSVALWNDGRAAEAFELAERARLRHKGDVEVLALHSWLAVGSRNAVVAAAVPEAGSNGDPATALARATVALPRRDGVALAAAAADLEAAHPALGALLRGHAGLLRSRWNDAAAGYSAVLALDPYAVQAYVDRSVAFHRLRRREEAVRDGLAAVRLDGSPAAQTTLVRALQGALSAGQRWAAALVTLALFSLLSGVFVSQALAAAIAACCMTAAAIVLLRGVRFLRRLDPEARRWYWWPPRRIVLAADIASGAFLGYWIWLSARYALAGSIMTRPYDDPRKQVGDTISAVAFTVGPWAAWAWWRRKAHLRWADLSAELPDEAAAEAPQAEAVPAPVNEPNPGDPGEAVRADI